jgi:hypothetical protein
MYGKNGDLKPIEINTAVGWHYNIIEPVDSVLDLNELLEFITNNNINKIVYIGSMRVFHKKLKSLCVDNNFTYEYHNITSNRFIPDIEDSDDVLIIRSAYDATALVDDTYCRNKIEFLNLIKDSSFGSQFAYMDDSDVLINNITTINNNGGHPNFILKYKYPSYDKDIYPKFYKVTTQEELNTLISNVVNNDYFLMEFHYNPTKLIENNIQVFRGLNILFPPNLESISIGGYTRICDNSVQEESTFDNTTFELINDRYKYITNDYNKNLPKLLDTDLVEMSDGTFKIATELVVGDVIKTIDIPNPFDVSNIDELANFKISFEELQNGTTYSTNTITNINKINLYTHTIKLTFTDGSDWFDNENSKYLSIKNNEVRFLTLSQELSDEYLLKNGDNIILIDTSNPETPVFVSKEIANIETIQRFFGGYEITVDRVHLFLTKSSLESNSSYVSIEHNLILCTDGSTVCAQGSCSKGSYCVKGLVNKQPCAYNGSCICSTTCTSGYKK